MWKQMAEAMQLNIPEAEMEKVAAILDSVYQSVRPALDRDLSTIEPAGVFLVQSPERK
jgi:hypothetical protein